MACHLRGTVLPDGSARDLWTLGDRITFERPTLPADTLADGGFPLPGRRAHPSGRGAVNAARAGVDSPST
ncbi:hypothetical protein [Streptomyces guryensis]|uniref:Uncharacterized protein n=1 Tax=Streptomyces guryensis TaxID=2886947 RepID=A0A9Q3Z457_9ACTN|nr:hypothetical protein [Streptomyces guryensis]MCD9873731.1 hypothetical protein [Streptomyces guryensis]